MDKTAAIKEEVQTLLEKIITTFEVEVTEDQGAFHVTIKTDEEAPIIIGRHGETIKALQKIMEVMMYKKYGEGVEILINVNDYREKQKERLIEIAERYIGEVKDTGRSTSIGRLSSYERKVIHEYITESHPDLASYSEGEGRDRRLVVAPKSEQEK